MPRNVEVKIRVKSLARVRRRLGELGATGPTELRQTDTYYVSTSGRLKVREESSGGVDRLELIGYRRPDSLLRTSHYRIALLPPESAAALKASLKLGLKSRAVVRKRRELWMISRDRIHLDRVTGLGSWLEIEAFADRGARRRTERLVESLGLAEAERIPGSYVDLVTARAGPTTE